MNTPRSLWDSIEYKQIRIAFAGQTPPPRTTETENYNGSTWSILPATLELREMVCGEQELRQQLGFWW